MEAIDWLLEEDAPGVELLARTRLLGESPGSRRARSLRGRCNRYPPVAAMLDRVDEAIDAAEYKKYEGGYWTLNFLAEMQADGRDRRAEKLARHILGKQLENGGFSTSGKASFEIVCLTANTLRALTALGYGDHPQVLLGYRRLSERIRAHGGVPCFIIDDYTLLSDCKMTLPQTLRSIAAAANAGARGGMREVRDLLIRKLLEIRIYRYVRPDTRRFREELVPLRPRGMTQKQFTADYRARHPMPSGELVPKKGWLRFGFPHSYNSDLLEAMLALAEAGAAYDPAMDEALDHIESKRLPDGRWRMETSLNGKMLADVEKKGAPSKWITLQALTVLQHFGRGLD